MTIGPWEFLVIGLVIALLFGGRFAQVAKGVGEGVRNFKQALAGKPADDAAPPAKRDTTE